VIVAAFRFHRSSQRIDRLFVATLLKALRNLHGLYVTYGANFLLAVENSCLVDRLMLETKYVVTGVC
jgi:hypothetical protein